MANVLNGIRQSRKFIASVHGILRGIRGDINDSFIQPVAELTLLLKDTLGLAKTIYDFVHRDGILSEVKEAWKQQVTANYDEASAIFEQLEDIVQSRAGGFSAVALKESLTAKIESGKPDSVGSLGDTADPVDALFKNVADHPELLDESTIDSLALSQEASKFITEESDRIRLIDAEGIRERRDKIANFAASVSEAFGGSSATYNRVNGINTSRTSIKRMTVADIEILAQLNSIVTSMDTLITEMEDAQATRGEDYYSFYIDYAIANGLSLDSNNASKFYVPFPSGASLESLSMQYLGDPDRWPEIAALNALRAPYVDELGVEKPVTGSGGGNTLNVGNQDGLYVGQVVTISSNTQSSIRRKIRTIDVFSSAETILSFEPTDDDVPLSAYKETEGAKILAY
jgi:hypothetical protein